MEAALITFLNNAQAKSAYHSTEPILNNRFIKVFFHKGSHAEEGAPGSGAGEGIKDQKLSIKERLGEIPPPHKLQLKNNNKPPATPTDPNSSKVSSQTWRKTMLIISVLYITIEKVQNTQPFSASKCG